MRDPKGTADQRQGGRRSALRRDDAKASRTGADSSRASARGSASRAASLDGDDDPPTETDEEVVAFQAEMQKHKEAQEALRKNFKERQAQKKRQRLEAKKKEQEEQRAERAREEPDPTPQYGGGAASGVEDIGAVGWVLDLVVDAL